MGIGVSKCQKELKLEKKAIKLFLKHGMSQTDDWNGEYDSFKANYPTMHALTTYENNHKTNEKETETEYVDYADLLSTHNAKENTPKNGGTLRTRRQRRRTRRNRFIKR